MSADDAEKRAGEILGEIRPATRFIIDDANIYSVKPLLMFDAAASRTGNQLGRDLAGGRRRGGGDHRHRQAAGGLHAHDLRADLWSRGNVFVRLVFQNLF